MKPHWWQKSIFLIWICGIAALLITLGLFSYSIRLHREADLERGRSGTWALAGVVANDTERTLFGIHQIFRGIRSFLRADERSGEPFAPSVRRMLDSWMSENPFLMDLLILDAKGDILHWTGPGAPPKVRDRDYASAHLGNDASGFFVGEPKLSRVHENQWFFGVSAPLRDGQGRLDKILVAIIQVSYLYDNFRRMEMPSDSTVLLVSDRGSIYTRFPGHERYVGTQLSLDELPEPGQRGRRGVHRISPLDGRARIWSIRPVGNSPLFAGVSYDEEQLLSAWRRDTRILVSLASFIGLGILLMTGLLSHLQRRQQRTALELERLATLDALTGLANRRQFMSLAAYELNRAKRSKLPLSVIMMDLDHFKSINDRFGHEGGDRVLKAVGALLQQRCRKTDTVARLGGEEFALLLPETGKSGARVRAEILRKDIEALRVPFGSGEILLSASLGVSRWRQQEEQIDLCLSRADAALYRAKWRGRNQVCTDDDAETSAASPAAG